MNRAIGRATFRIIRGDLTTLDCDAVVNAANSALAGGAGVDGAIHRRGGPSIMAECRSIIARIGRLEPGRAVITTGGDLPARHVIHTVGPVWHGGNRGEAETLASSYLESLALASRHNLATVAFPSISTGAYGYPVAQAAPVALAAIRSFLEGPSSLREVTLVLFDPGTHQVYLQAAESLFAGAPAPPPEGSP
jgi:O-acetyl-ADP-ribose deacetylase (regulator of RNase III)